MAHKNTKKDLEDKIKELDAKLARLSETLESEKQKPIESKKEKLERYEKEYLEKLESEKGDGQRDIYVLGQSPIGHDKRDTIKQIASAKKDSTAQAGLVKNTEDGSVLTEDKPENVRIPLGSIHLFTNMEECECGCHPMKKDCQNCYDHPEHLTTKREIRTPTITEESIEEIPQKKESIWSKLKRW